MLIVVSEGLKLSPHRPAFIPFVRISLVFMWFLSHILPGHEGRFAVELKRRKKFFFNKYGDINIELEL